MLDTNNRISQETAFYGHIYQLVKNYENGQTAPDYLGDQYLANAFRPADEYHT
ncbi:hypothetical protein NTGM5_640005 [Candidatus Nitrotoga sp. M5]|nr:hypothetical protein NTGM5_640005 [Candidatus Nitrotoga sp. M5]